MPTTDTKDTLSRLCRKLEQYTTWDAESITAGTPMADLGLDSLDVIELAMDCEAEWGITLGHEQVEAMRSGTVGNAVRVIEEAA